MKILFLDFDGVITTHDSRWCIDINKVKLVNDIVSKTEAKIVVTSSWKHGCDNVEDFKNRNFNEKTNKCSPLWYQAAWDNMPILETFLNNIYDITDSKGSWRGDEIERWLEEHEDEIENYVILDDDSDFRDEQLFNFVQTDTYEGLTEREVKLCIARLNNKYINNPIRMNLVLITMWRNRCSGLVKDGKIDSLWEKYISEMKN